MISVRPRSISTLGGPPALQTRSLSKLLASQRTAFSWSCTQLRVSPKRRRPCEGGVTQLPCRGSVDPPVYEDVVESSVWEECRELIRLSTPAFFQSFLAFSLSSVVFLFLGRLGTLQLSVASLATSIFYISGASLVTGLSMGIETLGGQAHGAGNKRLLDLTLLQGLFLSLTTCLTMSVVWTQSEWIFLKLGQNPAIAKKASVYLKLLIPYLFMDALFTCQSKSLASRGVVRPTTVACGWAFLLAPFLSYLLIFKSPLGIYGAPITEVTVSLFTMTVLSLLSRSEQLFNLGPASEWIREGWGSLGRYFSVTLPGLATICSEWWTYEVFTVLAGLLATPELSLGIMGAANSVICIIFVMALALAAGVIVRVSNFLGAGMKQAAVASAKTAICMALFFESLLLLTVCALATPISQIWFTDVAAGSVFVSVLPLVGITEWGSGMSFVLGAVLRACNRGKYEFLTNFSCYWFVGIPLGLFLGFSQSMGVHGFWIGLAVAANLQFWILLCCTARLDVDVEIKRARQLTRP